MHQPGISMHETAEPTPSENKNHYFYDPNQTDYGFEDIEAIVKKFPSSKRWTSHDLENTYIFPSDLTFKIQLLGFQILSRLQVFMGGFAITHNLGEVYVAPVGLKVNEGTVLEPDVLFVSIKKQYVVKNDKDLEEAPDLVVEVLSPSNYPKLREQKKQQYTDFGVQEYWEIHPKKQKVTVETLQTLTDQDTGVFYVDYQIYSEATGKGTVKSEVLTGFELDVATLF